MEDRAVNVDTRPGVSVSAAAGKPDSETGCSDTLTSKRVVKLSAKGLADKIDRLQHGRKTKQSNCFKENDKRFNTKW